MIEELDDCARTLEDEGEDELLDSFLTLEELSSVWLDDVAGFSEELLSEISDELLGVVAIEELNAW